MLDRERGLEALRAQGDVETVKVARLQQEVKRKKNREKRGKGKRERSFQIPWSALHYYLSIASIPLKGSELFAIDRSRGREGGRKGLITRAIFVDCSTKVACVLWTWRRYCTCGGRNRRAKELSSVAVRLMKGVDIGSWLNTPCFSATMMMNDVFLSVLSHVPRERDSQRYPLNLVLLPP